MGGWGVMDFAGGIVVHATAGTAALVCAVMVGRRRHFPQSQIPPHSPALTMIGASMLWVGWFGFNGGSALGAGGGAGMALLVTHIAAATASLVWMGIEWMRFGRPSLVGIVTGMVAGLATVTPATGFIGVPGGLILGLDDSVTAGSQFMVQLSSVAITVAWTLVVSMIILMIAKAVAGLRVDDQTEVDGLDLAEHVKRGYPGN